MGKSRAQRPQKQKASDDQLLSSYAEFKSCRVVASRFDMCAQSVHERLAKLGTVFRPNQFSTAEIVRLKEEYIQAVDVGKLDDLAAAMGREKTTLCKEARKLGLTRISGRPAPWAIGFGDRVKASHKANGHPRGMLGKKHSATAKAKISIGHKETAKNRSPEKAREMVIKTLQTKAARGNLSWHRRNVRWKGGWREIGGKRTYYRSRWEANYARYLQLLKDQGAISGWEHEAEVFWFEEGGDGVRCYLPDFRVMETSGTIVYHEVKGWMDPKSKIKLDRMAVYHPGIKIVLIEAAQYAEISFMVSKLIDGWESGPKGDAVYVPKAKLALAQAA